MKGEVSFLKTLTNDQSVFGNQQDLSDNNRSYHNNIILRKERKALCLPALTPEPEKMLTLTLYLGDIKLQDQTGDKTDGWVLFIFNTL